ncbi:unnamed protein product [Pseudo-nitzschia multistriata]|uniref:CRAL/TRIO N-terminal domain-containing protein n=1 Tax=Pseudo-nitzschia multistriata TaxID=183589 RepID=A0A448ZPE4_9STRA|nr:unnamed protein product [Pseudo-nitzschia multistriata]
MPTKSEDPEDVSSSACNINYGNEFLSTNNDPETIDILFSEELLKLSIEARNEIQEEAHGVRCLAPEETPEMIRDALRKFSNELDKLPRHTMRAYHISQKPTQRSPPQRTFVNTDDFRLRFLRAQLFDVPKAARCMANYLKVILDHVGEYALFRPIRLNDFTKEEQRVFRKGLAQLLPYRDRHGRRVLVVFMGEDWEEVSVTLKAAPISH